MPRLPSPTIRLRLTALYGGLFLVSGTVLLVITYILFRRANGQPSLIVPGGGPHLSAQQNLEIERKYHETVTSGTDALHQGLVQALVVLGVMTVVSVVFGYLVAGRVLRPLREMTATTRQISERNLNERLALTGPRDELKDLADTIDGLLARLEVHVAGQQRFAANASHELRTPLALTQTILEVARNDPDRDGGELVDRLHDANTRAIELTEALLLLSRADQRAFTPERVDLDLVAEEAVEALLPLAERRGVAIEAACAPTAATGSPALLLQLATNLVQNAIVHNLPAGGTVWVATRVDPEAAVLSVENTGEELAPSVVSTLSEPFLRADERVHNDHAGVGLGLAIVRSIVGAHDGTLALAPRAAGGLRVTVRLPLA